MDSINKSEWNFRMNFFALLNYINVREASKILDYNALISIYKIQN
jgi:hypothetical protein